MKNEFIKKIQDCKTGGCLHCTHCINMNSEMNRDLDNESRTSSDLYDKEVEAYYFYFIRNKAS